MLKRRTIVLFLPPYAGQVLGPPLGLLCLAAPLREAGYEVTIIDGAIEPDYLASLERELEDALCFGISLLTGSMIRHAVAAARRVKALRPELPVILGGWHPSLLPAQTLQEEFVDIVVRHQGEITLLEIANRLQAGKGLDMIAGCWFKRDGRIHQNPDRPMAPLEALAPPAFDLADFDSYESASGERKLTYATSVGCPYACNYCTDMVFYKRRFNAYSARRVVQEVTSLVSRHRLHEVAMLDSNFLVDTKRAVQIARGFVESGARFRWTFQASTDLLCRMPDEDVQLLGTSGVSHIGFGTESGSEEVLVKMNKHHQRIEDMFEAARKCKLAGIRTTFNLIFGYPGETEADRRQTWKIMGQIADRFDNVSFSPNVFTPYPGIPVWPELKELGVKEPASLEEWAGIDLGTNILPWLTGKPYERLHRGISYFLLSNEVRKAMRTGSRARLLRTLRRPLRWRMRHQFFRAPLELWLVAAKNWLIMRRSLITGQSLGCRLERIC
jgi:anaerobic magnesium-protoporphyrin IX monomethyl ester cyclase